MAGRPKPNSKIANVHMDNYFKRTLKLVEYILKQYSCYSQAAVLVDIKHVHHH